MGTLIESSLVEEPITGLPTLEIRSLVVCSSPDHQKVKAFKSKLGDLAAGKILPQVFHFRLEGKEKPSLPA